MDINNKVSSCYLSCECKTDKDETGREVCLKIAKTKNVPCNTFIKINDKYYRFKWEPWKSICFSDEEINKANKNDSDEFLLELAKKKTKSIKRREKWNNGYWFKPEESKEPYGMSVFIEEIGEKYEDVLDASLFKNDLSD